MRRATIVGVASIALVGGLVATGLYVWILRASSAPPPRAVAHTPELTASPVVPPMRQAGSSASAGTTRVHGRVQDRDGLDLSGHDGTMRLIVDGTPEPQETRIFGATWQATVPKGDSLGFTDIAFGERRAVAIQATWPISERPMNVRCCWVVPTLLRVVDESGHDITRVEVVRDDLGDLAPLQEAQEFVPDMAAASSPIEINSREGALTYWVRAPGFAWSRVTVFIGFGGERVVRLTRSGLLQLRLQPYDPDAGVVLHLSCGPYGFFWEPDESGTAEIDSLPPGRYSIRVQLGRLSPLVVAEAVADVTPAAITSLTLPLHRLPAHQKHVPLGGPLLVDLSWHEEPDDSSSGYDVFLVQGNSSGAPPEPVLSIERADGHWVWSLGNVAPATYCVHVKKWGWAQLVETGPHGNTSEAIMVPPACDVQARVVDTETGDSIATDAALHWRLTSAETRLGLLRCHDARPNNLGIYRFRAPLGRLLVTLQSDSLSVENTELELKRGLNQLDLQATWRVGFELAFKDGTMPVPVDPGYSDHVNVVPLHGNGALDHCGLGYPCPVFVTQPGRYRVSFAAPIEGYEPPPPLEVDVAARDIPVIVVQLARRER